MKYHYWIKISLSLLVVLVQSANTTALVKRNLSEGFISVPDNKLIKIQSMQNATQIEILSGVVSTPPTNKTETFLVKSADARMMDAAEGALAAKNGTTDSIRKYGELMVSDQAVLLSELKKLADLKGVILPDQISKKKEHYRQRLAEKSGSDFDQKFIRMITLDHKRDIRMFRRASKSDDADISNFARQYLPMIESHLEGIMDIKNQPSH